MPAHVSRVAVVLLAPAAACSVFVDLEGLHGASDASVADAASEASDDAPAETTPDDAADGDAATSSVALVAHAIASFHGPGGVTTSAMDTAGATVLIAVVCTYAVQPTAPTDTNGNTWAQASSVFGAHPGPGFLQLFYVESPVTGNAQTVSVATTDYVAVSVLAFSGTRTTGVFDGDYGAYETSGQALQVGPQADKQPGELGVSFACSGDSKATTFGVDAPFSLVDTIETGSEEDLASAWATLDAAANPTWTLAGDSKIVGITATFKHP